MPDGSEAYRETVIRKKNAAGVLAVDTDGRLLFVRQYRHPFREMLLEIPAGVIEEGESGEAAVLRELEEETGKRAGRAEFLCELYHCHRQHDPFLPGDGGRHYTSGLPVYSGCG